MRLHVLPPAFDLPSIDAECNAAIAFLQLRLRDRFEVVPTHDLGRRLPFLVDGRTRSSGFNGIVRYIVEKDVANQSASSHPKDRADSLAIASFVELHAETLLDISLYVSFENYRHATRPAFTKVLPWYANYILPPQRRSAARSRTEHLGISSIDVDNVHEDMSNRPPGFDSVAKEQEFEAATQKRASLLLPRKETVRSLLQRPEHAAVFRLHALANNFFEPLQDLLATSMRFSEASDLDEVDCLVFGYLSLMLFPKLPQDWLASTLRSKYGKLVAYVERIHQRLRLGTNAQSVMDTISPSASAVNTEPPKPATRASLSWRQPSPITIFEVVKYIGNGIFEQLPIIGSSQALHLLHVPPRSFVQRHLSILVLTILGSSAGLSYLAIRSGFLVWPHGEETQIFGRRRLADYGHLGAALAGISLVEPSIKPRA